MGTERRHSTPHILFRKWIIPRVLAEAPDLTHDVLRPLSSQPRRYCIALRPCSVTPGTVANGGALAGPGRSAGGEDRHDRHFQTDALHDPRLSRFMYPPTCRRMRWQHSLQITDIGRDRFNL